MASRKKLIAFVLLLCILCSIVTGFSVYGWTSTPKPNLALGPPQAVYSWKIDTYSNGTHFLMSGDQQIVLNNDNTTYLEQQAYRNTSNGYIVLFGVYHNLALLPPTNVLVSQFIDGQETRFTTAYPAGYVVTVGTQSLQGPKGDKGDTGTSGATGATGAIGLPGANALQPVNTASFVLGKWPNGTYFAQNGTDGTISFASTDFASVLQSVSNAATSTGSISVVMQTGCYILNHMVSINPPTITTGATVSFRLVGMGNAMTTLKLSNTFTDPAMFQIGNSVLPYFGDFSADGNDGVLTQPINAFIQNGTLNQGVDCTFYNIWFHRWSGVQINLTRGWDHNIDSCQFEASKNYGISIVPQGIDAEGASTRIVNNYFTGNGGGIFVSYQGEQNQKAYNVIIANNQFITEEGNPCIALAGVSHCNIEDNTCNQIYRFVQLLGNNINNAITISGNTILGFAQYAFINNSTNTASDIKIIGDTYTQVPAWSTNEVINVGNINGLLISAVTINTDTAKVWFPAINCSSPFAYDVQIYQCVFTGNFYRGIINATTATAIVIRNNNGLNPIGGIAKPIGTVTLGIGGTGSAVLASTNYTISGYDCFVTSTGGDGVSISIIAPTGDIIQSGLSSLTMQYLPIGYKVNFGAFTSAPTVEAWGN